MSGNTIEGPVEVRIAEHRRLDRQLSLREPGKWYDRLISESRVESPAYQVESCTWNGGHSGGNNYFTGEDRPPSDSEAAASNMAASWWRAARIRAARRRAASRRGIGSAPGTGERTWLQPLVPVPAVKFITKNGEFFGRFSPDKPLRK
jgi:hypothetical protein